MSLPCTGRRRSGSTCASDSRGGPPSKPCFSMDTVCEGSRTPLWTRPSRMASSSTCSRGISTITWSNYDERANRPEKPSSSVRTRLADGMGVLPLGGATVGESPQTPVDLLGDDGRIDDRIRQTSRIAPGRGHHRCRHPRLRCATFATGRRRFPLRLSSRIIRHPSPPLTATSGKASQRGDDLNRDPID